MTFSTQQKQDAIAQSFKYALRKYLNSDQLRYKRIAELEVIGFDKQTALALVVIEQSNDPDFSLLRATKTLVLKTVDRGENWQVTLNADSGSLMLDELVFLAQKNQDSREEEITDVWLITQWQIEGTYPTIYSSRDFGETWHESTEVDEFLRSKGCIFNYALGMRFRDRNEGVVIAKGFNHSSSSDYDVYFLRTQDGGKSWQEITSVPPWYFDNFVAVNLNWKERNIWLLEQKNNEIAIATINETFDKYL